MLLALPIGILIGISLGALGGGGSILTVPALVYLLGVSPHGATTMSLIIVGITSLVGAGAHLRAGRVRTRAGLVFGVLGAGGAFVGSRLSASIHPDVLLTAFSVLMAGAAIAMLRRQRGTGPAQEPTQEPPADHGPTVPDDVPVGARGGVAVRPAPTITAPPRQAPPSSPVRVVLAASIVGLVTGFFGVGGGFVVVPALVLALGFDMPTAVGTSLLVIAVNSASSLLSRIGTHTAVDIRLVIAFTAAAIVGTLGGSRIASKVKPERLVGAFALLMLAVAIYTAARSIPALV